MAIAGDELVVEYVLKDNYTRNVKRAEGATRSFGQQVDRAQNQTGGLRRSAMDVGRGVAGAFGQIISIGTRVVGVLAAVSAGVGAIGFSFMRTAGEFEALTMSLESVEGSGERAEKMLRRLRDLSKLPGLGFAEAIQSYTNLRRAGLDSELSFGLIGGIGNQVALASGGPEQFGRVMTQVMQAASKPFLQGEELTTMTESGIPAYTLIRQIFGTADTQELKRQGITSIQVLQALNEELSQMPQAGNSAKNAFENAWQAMWFASVQAGMALNEAFMPTIMGITEAIEKVGDAGIIKDAFATIVATFGKMEEMDVDKMAVDLGAGLLAMADTIAILKGAVDGFLNSPVGKLIAAGMNTSLIGGVATLFQGRLDANRPLAAQQLALKAAQDANDSGIGGEPDTNAIAAPAVSPQLKELKRIEENTRKVADLTQMIVGGGERGSAGITPVEMVGVGRARRGGGGRTVHVVVDNGAFQGAVSDIFRQLHDQGLVLTEA